MKWLLNFLRGTVTLLVSGAEPEIFLNQCARAKIGFWGVDRREQFSLTIQLPRYELARAEQIAQRCQCTVESKTNFGLPFFLLRFRKRYAIMLGVLVCLLSVAFLSRFILIIEIEGNQNITSAEILSTLRQHGVKLGSYGPGINQRQLSNEMLLSMDELSFFSLNLHGTRAQIIVRERTPRPDIVKENEIVNIVAEHAGTVTQVKMTGGQRRCVAGDTVEKGDVLISGLVDIQEGPYSEADLGTSLHRAQGKVYASTNRNLEAKVPLSAEVKQHTGEEKSRYALNLLGKRVKFYGNGGISFVKYDKISSTKNWTLSDGSILPFSLERETYRAYESQTAELDRDAAELMLKEHLQKTLEAYVGTDGEIMQTQFETREEDGFLIVALSANCIEDIGKAVPLEPLPETPIQEDGSEQQAN